MSSRILNEMPANETISEEETLEFLNSIKGKNGKITGINDLKDEQGNTLLLHASAMGFSNLVSYLIEKGANPAIANTNGVTPLMMASMNGHLDILILLNHHLNNVNSTTKEGVTALMVACMNGHPNIVLFLIKANAYVNLSTKDGTTALMLASEHGDISCVDILLKANAKIHAKTRDGDTALSIASDPEIVKLLEAEQQLGGRRKTRSHKKLRRRISSRNSSRRLSI
jgi:ankyrin repeat protein